MLFEYHELSIRAQPNFATCWKASQICKRE